VYNKFQKQGTRIFQKKERQTKGKRGKRCWTPPEPDLKKKGEGVRAGKIVSVGAGAKPGKLGVVKQRGLGSNSFSRWGGPGEELRLD